MTAESDGAGPAGAEPAGAEPPGAEAADDRSVRFARLADSTGVAEAVQTLADLTPSLASSHALYAYGLSLALVYGDAAESSFSEQR